MQLGNPEYLTVFPTGQELVSATITEQLIESLQIRRALLESDFCQELGRYYLLDWLGSALAGLATTTGQSFVRYGNTQGAGSSTALGVSGQRSAEVAALINGALSHIVEMDDVERASVIHPAAVVIPAALAAAEQVKASSQQLHAAIAAGYEVAIRIGRAVGADHYFHFHNTSTCGAFGAAVAAGWLYRLSSEQLVWALGNAGTQAAGLWEFNTEGAQSKPLHTGRAAANGLLAALLAREGVSGARRVLEGERGFFSGLAPKGDVAIVTRQLDAELLIGEVSIKPHASCRHTHAPIDAALQVHGQLQSDFDQLQQVDIGVYPAAQVLCDKSDPQSVADAKFSLQYCVATALLEGRVGLQEFSPQALANERTRELMKRVSVSIDPESEAAYPHCWSAVLTTHVEGRGPLVTRLSNPKGDPENRLQQGEMERKFATLVEYGAGEETATVLVPQLLDWIKGLQGDQLVTVGPLAELGSSPDLIQ